jgi:hypothetical protein
VGQPIAALDLPGPRVPTRAGIRQQITSKRGIGPVSEVPTTVRSLAALSVRLEACGLHTELTASGLRVTNPNVPGCCQEVEHPSDLIKCHSRQGYATPWFWTSWRDPLAPAHRLDDALVRVRAYLVRAEDRHGLPNFDDSGASGKYDAGRALE